VRATEVIMLIRNCVKSVSHRGDSVERKLCEVCEPQR
jgi:hypothetical protein